MAIHELVLDQMQQLGLAHLIGILIVGCTVDPGPGPSRFKRPASLASSDSEDLHQDEEERPMGPDSPVPAECDT